MPNKNLCSNRGNGFFFSYSVKTEMDKLKKIGKRKIWGLGRYFQLRKHMCSHTFNDPLVVALRVSSN